VRSLLRLVSGALLLGLAGTQASCTFPSDWEFLSGGASTGGTSTGGNGTGAGATTSTGATGGNTSTGATGGDTSTGGMGGATSTGGVGGIITTGGAGGVAPCGPDTDDCDMNPANGCEANLKSTQHCGACDVPCQLANAVNPCATGECMLGACISPYENCDNVEVNGCEANLLGDKNNCGNCGTVCSGTAPNCNNGVCTMGCTDDVYEPNELVQAPLPPPMPPTMEELDPNDNDFALSTGKTGSVSPGFTTNDDVDVFYLHVTDDVPLPPMTNLKGVGFDVTVSGIPAGATYSVKGYWRCDDMSPGVSVFNYNGQDACPIGGTNTGFSGDWWFCQQFAASPGLTYKYGHSCATSGDANGILQLEVKVVGPPTVQSCTPYTLTVHVFPIAIQAN
jgi:hypothetical protein